MAQAKISLDNIVSIMPNFDGKKSHEINHFIKQFDELVEEIDITEKVKIILLKAKLVGQARENLINDEIANKLNNYTQFTERLIQIFQKSRIFEETQGKFMKMKQKPNQNIQEYQKEFETTATHYLIDSGHSDKPGAQEFLNSLKLTRFLESIRPDIALEVRKTGPENYKEAVERAKKIERAYNTIPSETVNTTTNTRTEDLYNLILDMGIEHKNEIKKLNEKIQTTQIQGNKPPETLPIHFCAICQINSHATKDCWFNAKSNNFRGSFSQRQNYPRARWQYTQNMPAQPATPQQFSTPQITETNNDQRQADNVGNTNFYRGNFNRNQRNRGNFRNRQPRITFPSGNE